MLVFAAIGMAGFLMLLILWLWVLPERETGPGWWPALAVGLASGGLTGTVSASYGLVVASCVAAVVGAGAAWLYHTRVTIH